MVHEDDAALHVSLDRAAASAEATLNAAIDVEQRLREFYSALRSDRPRENTKTQ